MIVESDVPGTLRAVPVIREVFDEHGARIRLVGTGRQHCSRAGGSGTPNLQQMNVKMLMLDELHNILAGTGRDQRTVLNMFAILPITISHLEAPSRDA